MKSLQEILEVAKSKGPKTICIAAASDEDVLLSVAEARKLGIANAILVGNREKIVSILTNIGEEISNYEIVDEQTTKMAVYKSVELVRIGKADILMKGKVETGELMKGVLDRENGLRTDEALSHVSVTDVPSRGKLIYITDAALNISPDLTRKASIVKNAVKLARALGIDEPKVAVLAAIEFVNQDMPVTIDAAALSKMAERGQIKDCILDGPVAFDNAISLLAAEKKGIKSPIAGEADIFLVPDIEAGNIMLKSIVFLANGSFGGIIMGAKKPVIITSRADSALTKLYSIATAVAIS